MGEGDLFSLLPPVTSAGAILTPQPEQNESPGSTLSPPAAHEDGDPGPRKSVEAASPASLTPHSEQ
jgi:hypothetical protein